MCVFSRRKNPKKNSASAVAGPDLFEQSFWRLYRESLQLKDRCALMSAYKKRVQANELALQQRPVNKGYIGMGYHNLAILNLYHISAGLEAAKQARQSLECGDDFYKLSEKRRDILQFGAHLESLQVAAMTSTSYDEAISYINEGKKLYGGVFADMLESLLDFRKTNPRYGAYQRAVSLTYYSRVSAELDKGNYAPALGLMEIMLTNAEAPEYDYSYEEYVDILDDYACVTVMLLLEKGRILNGTNREFAEELAWIADKPLKMLADFMPDCQPGDREKFEMVIDVYRNIYGIAERNSFKAFR
ncbi:MAG: hypothetical protein GX900_02895 [Clostridiaceae bacterium]|nr:hypothetical protein [Clostridiaceae bacterium]